ncbi:DUF1772 domain-containing protein [Rubrobacter tropicus]|uniref:DUF1772 domain-containing protein n=1 Tax=Rubrobacter tropicus TaxID=2653851 RepID=UPI00140D4141|nr:DUF1772 domain-containing protein [Rubrobacter tropicus]
MSSFSRTVSVACAGAFAGGCLVVSVVLVPTWREMDPEAFLAWFQENGPRLGLTLFPLEVAGALFAVLAFFGAVRRGSNGRLPWGLSSLCIVATLVLLPLYFAGANARMIEGNMGAREVGAELASWQGWQWLRTALAVLAVAFGGWGLGRERAERTPK